MTLLGYGGSAEAASKTLMEGLEEWVFVGDNYLRERLRTLQEKTPFSRRVFIIVFCILFHLSLIRNPAAPAMAHLATIAYPIYWSLYNAVESTLPDPTKINKLVPLSLPSLPGSSTTSEAGAVMVFWIIFSIYTLILTIYPANLLYFIEPALHFYLWCPVIGGAKALHESSFGPVSQLLFHNHFDPIAWKKVYPWVRRLMQLAEMRDRVRDRLSGEEFKQFSATVTNTPAPQQNTVSDAQRNPVNSDAPDDKQKQP